MERSDYVIRGGVEGRERLRILGRVMHPTTRALLDRVALREGMTSLRFEHVIGPVDAVIDTVGGDVQKRSFDVLRRGGVLVSAVSPPDPAEADRRGVRALFMLVDTTTATLDRLARMFDAGELSTRVGVVMPLADARRAHEMLDGVTDRPRGKIVLGIDVRT